uniref:BZIP domain-containing protein n=1 Tax=Lepeophtheirus salmonis TaxID=72036 RepID=A0A0K2UA58_LEPSM
MSKSSPMEIVNMMRASPSSVDNAYGRREGASSSRSQDLSSQEAIESLLLLGQEPILAPKKLELDSLEFSPSSCSITGADGISYYQRMRIRNNEASKRCRLKRRLKAEQLESQNNLLTMSNKLLKQRILRLNKICHLLKDCVNDFKEDEEGEEEEAEEANPSKCSCFETVAAIKKFNRDTPDSTSLSNEELLAKSKLDRELEDMSEFYLDLDGRPSSSSDDEKKPKLTRSLSCQPVLNRTSLDAINETIVKTLKTPLVTLALTSAATRIQNSKPLSTNPPPGLISVTSPTVQNPKPAMSVSVKSPPSVITNNLQVIPPQLVFVTTKSPPPKTKEILIKCEPDLRVVEEVVETTAVPPPPLLTPSNSCLVMTTSNDNPYKEKPCGNELHSINKLTGYLDLTMRTFSRDDGTSAAERVIIKSALGLPFWQADELPSFICDNHRQEISFQTEHLSCVICGKKKKKPFSTPMSIITYRMSLEHHMNTGKILAIGQLICSICKDRYLKMEATLLNYSTNNQLKISSNLADTVPQIMGLRQNNTVIINKQKDVKVIVQPVPRITNFNSSTANSQLVSICNSSNSANEIVSSPTTSLVPTSCSNDNIFHKISRLNDALQAVNPRYRPIGFSITSIESCSPSVLQDAVAATDTAISTLLSVIAPGQESLLWESVKVKLDEKYCNKKASISPI